jgi:hypothetical protein
MSARFAPAVFGFVSSCLMSLLITAIATLRKAGSADDFFSIRSGAWRASWIIALPVILVVIPFAVRIVGVLIKAGAGKA